MKTKTLYHFAHLTKEREKKLVIFESLTPAQYDEIEKKARAEFNAQNITAERGRLNFNEESAFISSADTLNGFYFPSASLRDTKTNYKLLCISFELKKHFDFKTHQAKPDTLEPVAIYEDESEKLYIRIIDIIKNAPLEKWQQEINREILTAQVLAQAWRKVERLRKKGGGDFARMAQNFKGCTISPDADGYRVDIFAHSPYLGYISDTLYNINSSIKTADDIEAAIDARISELDARAEEKTKILANSSQIYEEIAAALIEIINKYGTPSNAIGVYIPYFKYKVEDFLKCL